MSLVLVVSNSQDAHVAPVVECLLEGAHRVARFDTDRVPDRCTVSFRSSQGTSETRFCVDGFRFAASDVTSVWWRRPEEVPVADAVEPEAAKFIRGEWGAAVQGALRTIDALWVNHPEALRHARHKILQLQLARAAGFTTPHTLVSADPGDVREFCDAHGGKVIAKLVDAGPPKVEPGQLQYMVYTTPLTDEDLASDGAIRAAPAIYQAYVRKAYELRVTVVGGSLFACAISSQETARTRIDWRRYDLDNTPHHAVTLDVEVRDRCLQIVRRLGLVFAAIDLIVTPEGDTVFLEVNPNGQWGWIEDLTGMPIAAAIADALARGPH